VTHHKAHGFYQKKGMASASERDEWVRAAWRVTVAEALEPQRLVFVDEMGVHTSLAPVYGYAPKGERLRLSVPRNRGKNTTLLSSMTLSGMGPSMAVEGATTAPVFETYVEHILAPHLKQGQVVVMDNLGAHKPKRIEELIKERGCELLYLPPYSPDYNPIEEAFSKIKALLRKVGARSREALVEAIGEALSAVSVHDARGFFEHAGYRSSGQLL
jgi:transposase